MKRWGIWLIMLGWLVGIQQPAWAAVGSTVLIEESPKYNQKNVTFEGEAIREAMLRGKNGWINVSDGSNAIGIWASQEEIGKVKQYGSYHNTGDRVRVSGVFHRSCPEHGGDLDIHARSLVVVSSGGVIAHPVSGFKAVAMFLLLAGAAVLHYLRNGRTTRSNASS